jgi:hypothetical protein
MKIVRKRPWFLLVLFMLFFASSLRAGDSSRSIKVTSSLDSAGIERDFARGTNYALIIGINEYANFPHLKTAVNDATALSRLLAEKYFFDPRNIVLITNAEATKARIVQELRDLVALKANKGDNVLIYYAGHGWYDDILKTGYWVTSEATKDPSSFLENNAVYLSIKALDEKGVMHVFLVSDSCFSGSFVKPHRSIVTDIDDRYFKEKVSKPSRIVLASGGVEPVADEGKDGHSVFAYYFLKALRDNSFPYISAKQVGEQVEEMVTRNSSQTPVSRYIQDAGDEMGEFFFINGRAASPPQQEVVTGPVSLPENGGTFLEDIRKAARDQGNAKEAWDAWEKQRETEFSQVESLDADPNLTPSQKAEAWGRFLTAVSQDNPYSQKTDVMRARARVQKGYWENQAALASLSVQGPARRIGAENIVARWKVDGPSSGVLKDLSGNGNDLAVFGAQYNGEGLLFDGYKDYAELDKPHGLDPSRSGWSVEAWVKPVRLTDNTYTMQNYGFVIIDKRKRVGSGSSFTLLAHRGASAYSAFTFAFIWDADNQAAGAESPPMGLNQWYHLVGVRDADKMYIYVNGIKYGPNNYLLAGEHIGSGTDIRSDSPVDIAYHGAWERYYNGVVKEISIFSKALSEDDVRYLFSEKP